MMQCCSSQLKLKQQFWLVFFYPGRRCRNNKSQCHTYLWKGAGAPSTTGRARSVAWCPGTAAVGAPRRGTATRTTGAAPGGGRRRSSPAAQGEGRGGGGGR
jgi:hypothetical protein